MTAAQAEWVKRLDELHLLTPFRIAAIIVAALVAVFVLRRLIARLLSRTIELPGADKSRLDVRQRALSTAMRSAVVGIVWSVAVIAIISEIGINLGAFIATATVVGGAIAFGAQTLIRDVIAGFFVLAEDQYGVGESIDVGHASGTVERITLRSVRLRDGDGRVWHVPHGGVIRVANLSKAPLALLDVEVSRSSSLDALNAIAGTLGQALKNHAEAGPLLAGEPTIVGLTDVRDDRLVFRVSVPTVSGSHDDVKRIWRVLALQAFQTGELIAPPAPTTIVQVNTDAGTS